jgi:pimeloyl-ACP methyl ester carboxylesterase
MSEDKDFVPHGNSEELVVVLHGLGGSREIMKGVRAAIRAEKPDADIYCPNLPYGPGVLRVFCRVPVESIIKSIMETMLSHWNKRQNAATPQGGPNGYRSITLVGHSLGGVLARKIAILAYGETPGTPFEQEFAEYRNPGPLAHAIKRIVMLAGLSRGWTVSSADSWKTAFVWGVLEIYGEMVAWITGTPYTIFAVRRGAPFLVQTRLQWLALVMRPMIAQKWDPAISLLAKDRLKLLCQNYLPDFDLIQLLGTEDDTVSPEDMLDNSVDMENINYYIVEVPNSSHLDIVRMKQPNDGNRAIDQTTPEHQRYTQFQLALSKDRWDLKTIAVKWEDVSDILPDEPEWNVTDVIFVIHGIRDKGFWTQKIARRVKQLARTSTSDPKRMTDLPYRSVTASYGYFAMVPFVLQPVRTRKVAWLMDQYTEARVRYPNAKFSYVGHSNGTYLVARALKDYPAARFSRIVFAGSVVRSDYDWKTIAKAADGELCQAPRVEKVLNYVATEDWVVAMFPKAMQLYKSVDLGGAGHDGFDQAFTLRRDENLKDAADAIQNSAVLQLEYVKGRHDAAIRETHWGDIASFVVKGTLPWLSTDAIQQEKTQDKLADSSFAKIQPEWSRVLGERSTILFPLVVAGILGLGVWLAWRIFGAPPCLPNVKAAVCASEITSEVVKRVGLFLAYLLVVGILTTRF